MASTSAIEETQAAASSEEAAQQHQQHQSFTSTTSTTTTTTASSSAMTADREDFLIRSLNLRIRDCGSDTRAVQHILRDMIDQKLMPTDYTLNHVLQSYSKARDSDGAEEQFERLRRMGVKPSAHCMTTLITIFTENKSFPKALEYFDMCETLGIEYSNHLASSIFKALLSTRYNRNADEVLRDAVSLYRKLESVLLDLSVWSMLFIFCSTAKNQAQSALFLDELLQKHAVTKEEESDRSYLQHRTVISSMGGADSFLSFARSTPAREEGLRRLGFDVSNHNDGASSSSSSSSTAATGFGKKDFEEIDIELKRYNNLIQDCGADSRAAEALYHEMIDKGLSPSSHTLNRLLNCFKKGNDARGAIRIFETLTKQRNIMPNTITFNTLIGTMATAKMLPEAYRFFEAIASHGLAHDVTGIGCMLKVLLATHHGRPNDALMRDGMHVFEEWRKTRVPPCASNFSCLFIIAAVARDTKQSCVILDELIADEKSGELLHKEKLKRPTVVEALGGAVGLENFARSSPAREEGLIRLGFDLTQAAMLSSQTEDEWLAKKAELGLPKNFQRGDWICPSCNKHVFTSKMSCPFGCGTGKPQDVSLEAIEKIKRGSTASSSSIYGPGGSSSSSASSSIYGPAGSSSSSSIYGPSDSSSSSSSIYGPASSASSSNYGPSGSSSSIYGPPGGSSYASSIPPSSFSYSTSHEPSSSGFGKDQEAIDPLLRSYNAKIQECASSGNTRAAEGILREMIDRRVSPSVFTLNHMLRVFQKAKDAAGALRIFDTLTRQRQVSPDTVTYCTLMGICGDANNLVEASRFFELIGINKLPYDSASISTMLKVLISTHRGRAGNALVRDAIHVFEVWRQNKVRSEERNYCALLICTRVAGDKGQAAFFLDELLNEMDKGTVGDVKKLKKSVVVEALGGQEALDDYARSSPARCTGLRLLGFGVSERAPSASYSNKPLPMPSNNFSSSYSTLEYHGHGETGVDVQYYNKRIQAECGGVDCRKAEALLYEMLEKRIEPSVFTFNFLLVVFSNARDTQGALRVFDMMSSRKISPNVATFNILVNIFGEAKDLEQAKRFFFLVGENGLIYEASTISAMLQALINTSKVLEDGDRQALMEFTLHVFDCWQAGKAHMPSSSMAHPSANGAIYSDLFVIAKMTRDTRQASKWLDDLLADQERGEVEDNSSFNKREVLNALGSRAALDEFARSSHFRSSGLKRLGFDVPEVTSHYANTSPVFPSTSSSSLLPSSSSASSSSYRFDDTGLPSNFRAGDWICPRCSNHVFASKSTCSTFLCGVTKPQDISLEAMSQLKRKSQSSSNSNNASSSNSSNSSNSATLVELKNKMNSFANSGKVREAHGVLNEIRNAQRMEPSYMTYSILLKAYCRAKDKAGAEALFNWMRNEKMEIDVVCINQLIDVHSMLADLEGARRYLNLIFELRLETSIHSFAPIFKAITNKSKAAPSAIPGLMREVNDLARLMTQNAVPKDKNIFAHRFFFAKNAKDRALAAEVLEELIVMPNARLECPDKHTIIDALGGTGALEEFALSSPLRQRLLEQAGLLDARDVRDLQDRKRKVDGPTQFSYHSFSSAPPPPPPHHHVPDYASVPIPRPSFPASSIPRPSFDATLIPRPSFSATSIPRPSFNAASIPRPSFSSSYEPQTSFSSYPPPPVAALSSTSSSFSSSSTSFSSSPPVFVPVRDYEMPSDDSVELHRKMNSPSQVMGRQQGFEHLHLLEQAGVLVPQDALGSDRKRQAESGNDGQDHLDKRSRQGEGEGGVVVGGEGGEGGGHRDDDSSSLTTRR